MPSCRVFPRPQGLTALLYGHGFSRSNTTGKFHFEALLPSVNVERLRPVFNRITGLSRGWTNKKGRLHPETGLLKTMRDSLFSKFLGELILKVNLHT